MHSIWKKALAACLLLFATAVVSEAATIRLVVDQRFNFTSPFGLAFDGTNLHVSNLQSNRVIRVMDRNTGALGATTMLPAAIANSALGWNGSQLVAGRTSTRQAMFFDRFTGANVRTLALDSRISGIDLVDGIDFDGGDLWFSPDIGPVYRLNGTTGQFAPGPNPLPIPPSAGGFSGVERVDTNCPDIGNIIIVVNDTRNPRTLQVARFDGTSLGETTLPNSRYEDLAYDGTHLYAADLTGNRVDKIRVFIDDCDIAGVPEPGTLTIAGVAVLGLLGYRLRRRQQA